MGGRGSSSGKSSASGAGSANAQINASNLPALEGTEKQIAYAEDLRKREIPRINNELQQLQSLSDAEFIERASEAWVKLTGIGIDDHGGSKTIDSKKILSIADDFYSERAELGKQIRRETGLSRQEAFNEAAKRVGGKYRKQMEQAFDIKSIAKEIESKTSSKWWIEKSRAVKF